MFTISDNILLKQIPGCVAWKDLELKYLGANQNLLAAMKLQHQTELIGRDDAQLNMNSSTEDAMFHQQDLLALQGHSLEIIHAVKDAQADAHTCFLLKGPLRNEQQKIVGIIYHCTPWSQPNLFVELKKIDQKYQSAAEIADYYVLDSHHNPGKLSTRELECLFLQLRGKTAKQIAQILQLSKRTIEYYIDNIKSKLGCQNKAELLVTAMTQGYQQHVPKSLLQLGLPELLRS
ncbi:MAG: PAS domain-containing protein [Gammaproteobacteria bacterium]|nr:PAS domain-containing protein [Gammaproteobacteria bacterium]